MSAHRDPRLEVERLRREFEAFSARMVGELRALEAFSARMVGELRALEARLGGPEPEPRGGREDRWLPTREAARYLGVSPKTLSNLASAGEVPSRQHSPRGRRYFRLSDLDRWREQQLPAKTPRLRVVG